MALCYLNFCKRYKDDLMVIFDQWPKSHLDLDALSNQKTLKGVYCPLKPKHFEQALLTFWSSTKQYNWFENKSWIWAWDYLWFKIRHLGIRETMRWVAQKNTNIFPHSGLIICSSVCTQKCARICLSVIELRASPHAN